MEQYLHRIQALSEFSRRLLSAKLREWLATPGDNGSRTKSLAVFYTALNQLPADDVRTFLRDRLPDYVLPSEYFRLETIPKTVNGKIDRAALRSMEAAPTQSEAKVPAIATDEREREMSDIWSRILNVEHVDRDANFFELGGHSLLATQVLMEIEQRFGIETPLGSIFKNPTVAGLCRHLRPLLPATATRTDGLQTVPSIKHAPASNSQRRLWYAAQLNDRGLQYKLVKVIELRGRLNVAAFAQSITEIVNRHETLRTCFGYASGELVQKIQPSEALPIEYADLSAMQLVTAQSTSKAIQEEILRRPCDLEKGPVIRVNLLRLSATQSRVIVDIHHIVVDGWSIGILVRELNSLFRRFSQGLPSELAVLPAQFRDVAIHEKKHLGQRELDRQLAYWGTKLRGIHRLEFLHPHQMHSSVLDDGEIEFALGADVSARISSVCSRLQITPFMLLVSAYHVLLQIHTGSLDIAIGTDIANREIRNHANLIGFFVNQLVLRITATEEITFRELCNLTRVSVEEAFANKDIPYEVLVRELRQRADQNREPLFDAMFSFHHVLPDLAINGIQTAFLKVRPPTAKYTLLLNVEEGKGGLQGSIEYSGKVFDKAAVQRMAGDFTAICAEATVGLELPLLNLRTVTSAKHQDIERRTLKALRADRQRDFREFLAKNGSGSYVRRESQ
jgi:acyl carrier protein